MNPQNVCAGLALLACATAAQAVYTINIREVGPDVVMSGTGSINLTGMTSSATPPCSSQPAAIVPNGLCIGDSSAVLFDFYSGALGSTVAGLTAVSTLADSASGAPVMLALSSLYLPTNYVSNTPMSGSATFNGKTLVSMGLTAGATRTFTLPSTDRVVINVGAVAGPAAPASIPTLSEWGVIILSAALALFGLARVRSRR